MARTFLLVGWTLAAALVTLASVLFVRATDPGAEDILTNGGFEDGTSGWTTFGGALAITAQHYEGAYAGAIELSGGKAGARQAVDLAPGDMYLLRGRFLYTNPPVTTVDLALQWQNPEGDLFHKDFRLTESDGTIWLAALTEGTLSCDATSSEVRVHITGLPGAIILLDDLRLKVSPPEVPCPAPTATVTSSPIPTATIPAPLSPTRTASPTRTSTTSPTKAASATGTPPVTSTATSTVVASTATSTAVPSSTSSPTVAPVTSTPSHGLIVNGGFESSEGGTLVGWRTFGGALLQVADPVWAGLYAGCFASETSSTKWLYQTVAVTPGSWYELRAHAYQNDPNVAGALLRISWYESSDASGSAIATADSGEELTTPAAAYRPLTTGAVQAPANAHSANARVLLRPASAASARICVDEVSFTPAAPPVATPTASPTSSTSTPTATWPVTPTKTPTATAISPATRTSTATRTPTRSASPTRTPTTLLKTTSPPPPAATTVPPPSASPSPTTPVEVAALPPGELLTNGGFEIAGEDGIADWEKHGGVLGRVSQPVWRGEFAAELYSASNSTKWLYQTVAVEPGAWYQLDAYVSVDDPWVAGALLRVSWYESGDGSGSALAQADSSEALAEQDTAYRPLSTGPLRAPPNARSANVRVLLRPRDATGAAIHVDDVSFRAVDAPEPSAGEPPGDPEPDAAEAADDPAAAALSSSTSRASEVLGVSLSRAPAPIVPQPTPVIRRSARLDAPQDDIANGGRAPWWPWALAAGAAAAAGAGWAAYAWAKERSPNRTLD